MDRRKFLKIFGRGAAASAAVVTGVVAVKDLVPQPTPEPVVPYGLGMREEMDREYTILTGSRGKELFDEAIKEKSQYETMTVEKLEEILKALT